MKDYAKIMGPLNKKWKCDDYVEWIVEQIALIDAYGVLPEDNGFIAAKLSVRLKRDMRALSINYVTNWHRAYLDEPQPHSKRLSAIREANSLLEKACNR